MLGVGFAMMSATVSSLEGRGDQQYWMAGKGQILYPSTEKIVEDPENTEQSLLIQALGKL